MIKTKQRYITPLTKRHMNLSPKIYLKSAKRKSIFGNKNVYTAIKNCLAGIKICK